MAAVEKVCPGHQRRYSLWYVALSGPRPLQSQRVTDSRQVSQFTLLAKTTKGTKPDFHGAMGGEEANRLYHYFLQKVQDGYVSDRVKNGKFQAVMQVALVNDGPVRVAPIHPLLT